MAIVISALIAWAVAAFCCAVKDSCRKALKKTHIDREKTDS